MLVHLNSIKNFRRSVSVLTPQIVTKIEKIVRKNSCLRIQMIAKIVNANKKKTDKKFDITN